MGIIRTMGKFCYVECDTPNCNRKMEHIDEKVLKELAKLCGWVNRGNQWLCPACGERMKQRGKKTARSARKVDTSYNA